jgi:hypothetical protein
MSKHWRMLLGGHAGLINLAGMTTVAFAPARGTRRHQASASPATRHRHQTRDNAVVHTDRSRPPNAKWANRTATTTTRSPLRPAPITDGRSSWPEASHTNSLPGEQKERELR